MKTYKIHPPAKLKAGKKYLIKPSKKKLAEVFQIQVTPASILKLKPNAKYLLIFHRSNYDKGDLSILDRALQQFFSPAKVLAVFADQITDIKIAELVGGK